MKERTTVMVRMDRDFAERLRKGADAAGLPITMYTRTLVRTKAITLPLLPESSHAKEQ